MVAALYVDARGPYIGLPDVDPWTEERDARTYDGPWPVVAHPPCARWGRYWFGGPMAAARGQRRKMGDDDGCFAAALQSVRRFGGVLEHPADSHAWPWFGIAKPPRCGGWIKADWVHGLDGWTCCVEQGHYGHRARKATWLYAVGVKEPLPVLTWGPSEACIRLDYGYHSAEERRRAMRNGVLAKMGHLERRLTPLPFRDLLLSIARSVPQSSSSNRLATPVT